MIVQTFIKNEQVLAGGSKTSTLTLNDAHTGHLVTFQLTGLIIEETGFTLQGRLHPDSPWCTINFDGFLSNSEYILTAPKCTQYKLTIDNFSVGDIFPSAWIAN